MVKADDHHQEVMGSNPDVIYWMECKVITSKENKSSFFWLRRQMGLIKASEILSVAKATIKYIELLKWSEQGPWLHIQVLSRMLKHYLIPKSLNFNLTLKLSNTFDVLIIVETFNDLINPRTDQQNVFSSAQMLEHMFWCFAIGCCLLFPFFAAGSLSDKNFEQNRSIF